MYLRFLISAGAVGVALSVSAICILVGFRKHVPSGRG
jgi:hypothetical protein